MFWFDTLHTFTFFELSNFSKAFLNQVVILESPRNVVNRYFQAKSSTLVHSLPSRNDKTTMIWKLQEFGGQFAPIKRNMPNNVFWNTTIKHSRKIQLSNHIDGFLLVHKSTIHHQQLDAIHLCKCCILCCMNCS